MVAFWCPHPSLPTVLSMLVPTVASFTPSKQLVVVDNHVPLCGPPPREASSSQLSPWLRGSSMSAHLITISMLSMQRAVEGLRARPYGLPLFREQLSPHLLSPMARCMSAQMTTISMFSMLEGVAVPHVHHYGPLLLETSLNPHLLSLTGLS